MDVRIAPSLLSADFADLTNAVREVEAGGAKVLHFDVMDGHFVPNITFGPMVVRALRPLTAMEFDVHLMIYGAEHYIDEFSEAGADSITVQVEACTHLHRVIQQIKSTGAKAAVALNPATPPSTLEYIIGDIDQVLVMTVNPGFGGQEFIEALLPKITEVRRLAEASGREIDVAVDGGIDLDTCGRVTRAGANLLVAGNAVFNSPLGIARAVRGLQECAVSNFEGAR
ncbi:MAG: ribulose-phosphate 3-epimerase [Armatimonadetes bacterium]|nr:ribulose-phosphate 3-epimerase [Armatimonadota bacterium]